MTDFDNHHIADYTARGIASEALQAVRSSETLTNVQFKIMSEQQEEIRRLIGDLRIEMNLGFKSYDNKFWSLAITMITLLVGAVSMLVYKIIFPH